MVGLCPPWAETLVSFPTLFTSPASMMCDAYVTAGLAMVWGHSHGDLACVLPM